MKKIVAAAVASAFAFSGCGTNISTGTVPDRTPSPSLTQCSYIDDEVNDYDDLDPSDPNACYAPDDDSPKKNKTGLLNKAKKVEKAAKKVKKSRRK